jgi:hypothetical protein
MEVGDQRHAPAALPPGKRPGTHCIEGWVGSGPVWTGAENLAPTGILFPDYLARGESLYRLRYPAQSFQSIAYVLLLMHVLFILIN